VRGVNRKWRALHYGACTGLWLWSGVTDKVMHALCGRLPALTWLVVCWVKTLTADGLRAVGGLTVLTHLNLDRCANLTDAVLWEPRGHTALTELSLIGCTHVTDTGLQDLLSVTALRRLKLYYTSTTQAGRNALKAALPALTIHSDQ